MGFLLFFRVGLCPGQGQEDFFQASAVRGQLLQGAGGRQFAFGKDEHLLTDRLHLAEDMAGQNDGVGLAQLPDEFAHFDHLRRVQAHGRLVQNDDFWAAQQSLRNAHPLFIALGQAADEPGQHFFQPRPPGGTEYLLLALGTRDFFELCRKVQVLPHRHFRVERRLLRQIAHAGLGLVGLLRQRVPRHRYLPAGSREIPGEDIHNGRLARAVGPEQTVDLAVLHRERDIVHRQMTAVFFGEMGSFDHRITLLISASCALLLVYSRI